VQGKPHLSLEVEHRELEPRRHHADDVVWLAVDHEASAKDRRIAAEAALPQPVTDHGDVGFSVGISEGAS
jgi:hypothetical protein